jgi:nucleoside-diphosphate-sugar epimerase
VSSVLVTGPTGFIGRGVLDELSTSTLDVVAVCRNPQTAIAPHARWETADLLTAGGATAVIERIKPAYLLHLAWCAGRADYRTDPENAKWVEASAALASAFYEHGGVRAVFAGSSAEHEAPASRSLYARSKANAAARMHAGARTHHADFAWGRIFLPYGPHDAPHRLVPTVIREVLAGRVAHCSPGAQVRDFVYIADVAGALIDLLQADIDGPVDIGTGTGSSVRQAAEAIGRQIGKPELLRFDLPAPKGEPDRSVASVDDVRRTGRNPRTLDVGIAQTIAWHRSRMAA